LAAPDTHFHDRGGAVKPARILLAAVVLLSALVLAACNLSGQGAIAAGSDGTGFTSWVAFCDVNGLDC
jgi:hypothetical protein